MPLPREFSPFCLACNRNIQGILKLPNCIRRRWWSGQENRSLTPGYWRPSYLLSEESSSETSAATRKATGCRNPEEQNKHLHCTKNVKYHRFMDCISSNITVYLDVASCGLAEIDRRFGSVSCLYHQSIRPDDGARKHLCNIVSISTRINGQPPRNHLHTHRSENFKSHLP